MQEINDLYKRIGRMVRIHREKAGLTQEALAELVGLKRASITSIETGRQQVLLHTLLSIAKAVEVAPSSFLQFENEPNEMICYICGFDLEAAYGGNVRNMPDFYRIKTLKGSGRGKENKQIVLCSNCDKRILIEPEASIEALKKVVSSK
jgi:transcriptional regulator with XRE-family HTH domain